MLKTEYFIVFTPFSAKIAKQTISLSRLFTPMPTEIKPSHCD
ncbi:MAG: hypothetical protein ACJAQT_000776 [Akkermansiaceae bacterium]|jgi:hypothetical protein